MDNQEVFDKIATHLFAQGKRSLILLSRTTYLTGGGVEHSEMMGCAYRGEGGLKCAIGALIPDELYLPSFEGKRVGAVLTNSAELNNMFAGVRRDLLDKMQEIHDNNNNWLDDGLKLRQNLEMVAKDYKLSPAILTDLKFKER